jgi:acyl-CoA synthetase (AMP-forming)/AMP-acid ligase II
MLLAMAADGFGDRVVLGSRIDGLTADRLKSVAASGAALLREQDATALVYLDVNSPAFAVALFAAVGAGIPLVPINYRLSAEQQSRIAAHHPGSVVLTGPDGMPLPPPGGSVMRTDDWLALAAAREMTDADDVSDHLVGPADPAVIIYTSGTTAEPKGVVLRHENLVSYVLGTIEFGGADPEHTSLVSVPPYHIAAVANAVTNLYSGRRCIVLEQFSGERWLDMVRTEHVTHALVVPTMLARIMTHDGDLSVPSLRTLAYGGASMPPKIVDAALRAWPHVDFVNAYGLTETSSTIAVLGPEEHRAAHASDDAAVRARIASVGLPVPTVEIEVRGPDARPLPAGEIGRIWVRGEQVSGEYAGTGSVLDANGWFDTRDEGYLDEDGYLFVGGRADDTIIRGGENISPAEIEEAILALDGVEDAVVVGVPDHEWGQRLEAAVVAAPDVSLDAEAIREHIRGQLRSSKTPDRIVIWDELPRTETGKIIRRVVLERMTRETAALDD